MFPTIGERIKILRKKNKLTQLEFAKILDMKQSPISQIEKNIILPSLNTISLIIRKFNINYDWLIEGKGEMIKSGVSEGSRVGIGNNNKLINGINSRISITEQKGENEKLQLEVKYLKSEVENLKQQLKLKEDIIKLLTKIEKKRIEEA